MTNELMIRPEDVKRLREMTGAGIMDCKRALEEANGDLERATALLREKGLASAAKKAGRQAREGLVTSYIHTGGRLGVLLEVNCETDFVARTDDFVQLARDLAMQVAGLAPTYVSREDVPADALEAQRAAFAEHNKLVGDLNFGASSEEGPGELRPGAGVRDLAGVRVLGKVLKRAGVAGRLPGDFAVVQAQAAELPFLLVSATETSTCPSSVHPRTSICPPRGVYFTALSIRLARTWRRRTRSATSTRSCGMSCTVSRTPFSSEASV